MIPIETIRHSLSHILASAVQELYPETKFGMGPAIDNGFYYDFQFINPLTPADLPKIEKKMQELMKKDFVFEKKEVSKEEAKKLFKGQPYKLELIAELPEDRITVYASGNFIDLCADPHVKSSKELPIDGFKLNEIAGAYWKGSEKNKMLTRIYGLAFGTKKELIDYIKLQEEAAKRDHKKLGKDLDLFLIDPAVGLGLVMWQPKGAMLWQIMEDFWKKEHLKNGYQLVRTPHIGSRALWETSGHWGFYNESMYPPLEVGRTLKELQDGKEAQAKEEYLLKPMNCPFHVMIYKAKPKSYRDLPLRWAECGTVYRYEKSGELSGLIRVRGFTKDDAHIICSKDQIKDELKRVADFILTMLKAFGFKDFNVYLSLRDPKNKEKYTGSDEGWTFTEKILEEVAKDQGLKYKKEIGEAAFYGPKLDYKIKDCLGREWQCSTLQFDFNLPERFDMSFTNKAGEKERPFVLHRALFGSFERFIGLLIEHYAGAFPFWLAPVQIRVMPISDKHIEYARKLKERLEDFRVEIDEENETVSKKIRNGELQKIPYLLVVGDKEIASDSVSVRKRGEKEIKVMKINEFIKSLT